MVKVTRVSPFSGKEHTMEIPLDADTYAICLSAWEAGMYIRDAFPMLNADQREFIKTGITPAEWDNAFPEED